MLDHFGNDRIERCLRGPAKGLLRFGSVAAGSGDIAGAVEALVDAHDNLLRVRVARDFVEAFAGPFEADINVLKGGVDEVFDGLELARGEDEVVGLLLFHHEAEALHVVFGISPVAPHVDVAEGQGLFASCRDTND